MYFTKFLNNKKSYKISRKFLIYKLYETLQFLFQVLVAAHQFFLGVDEEEEKDSSDSEVSYKLFYFNVCIGKLANPDPKVNSFLL